MYFVILFELKEIALKFANVKVYYNYLIVVMNEGIHVSPDLNVVLEDIVNQNFYDRKFVYITHRKNSYSVDPVIYKYTSEIENLEGFAVVTKEIIALKNAEIEKLFLNKPFEIFKKVDDAVIWAKSILKNK